MTSTPAVVLGRRSEVLAWNALGHKLVAGHLDFDGPKVPAERPNMTKLLCPDGHTRALYVNWPEEAVRAVSSLRLLAGRASDDTELAGPVGELTLKSPEFAKLWAKHPVQNCMSGMKLMHHPEVGTLELNFEVLAQPDESGHRILMYMADQDSPAAAGLQLLATTSKPAPSTEKQKRATLVRSGDPMTRFHFSPNLHQPRAPFS
jgi:hypothetical protein